MISPCMNYASMLYLLVGFILVCQNDQNCSLILEFLCIMYYISPSVKDWVNHFLISDRDIQRYFHMFVQVGIMVWNVANFDISHLKRYQL